MVATAKIQSHGQDSIAQYTLDNLNLQLIETCLKILARPCCQCTFKNRLIQDDLVNSYFLLVRAGKCFEKWVLVSPTVANKSNCLATSVKTAKQYKLLTPTIAHCLRKRKKNWLSSFGLSCGDTKEHFEDTKGSRICSNWQYQLFAIHVYAPWSASKQKLTNFHWNAVQPCGADSLLANYMQRVAYSAHTVTAGPACCTARMHAFAIPTLLSNVHRRSVQLVGF